MAFNLKNFGKTSVTGTKVPLTWSYNAGSDNYIAYSGDGYFDDIKVNLSIGDVIYVNSDTDYSMLRITQVTPTVGTEIILPAASPSSDIVTFGKGEMNNGSPVIDQYFNIPGLLSTDIALVSLGGILDVGTHDTAAINKVVATNGQLVFTTTEALQHFYFQYIILRA